MAQAKFLFGDIVVVDKNIIGVVLKTWENFHNVYTYDVYNRMTNLITTYNETSMERYRVRHKYLNEEEYEYQNS